MPMLVPYTLIVFTTTAKNITFKNHLEKVNSPASSPLNKGTMKREAKNFTSLTLIQTHTYENEELLLFAHCWEPAWVTRISYHYLME